MGGARITSVYDEVENELTGSYSVRLANGVNCEVAYASDDFAPETNPLQDADLRVRCSNGQDRWIYRSRFNPK